MPNAENEKNRTAWNEMVEVHFKHPDYLVKEFLGGDCTLHPIEIDELGDVNNKSLLHLFCQFGLDTLSWARRGATVTGVDISDRSIARANELVEKTGIDARFIRSDIIDLIGKIDRKFDIVFQSYGTLAWIEDLKRWAEVAAWHLKPGGTYYIVELHPIAPVFEEEGDYSYWHKGPYLYKDDRDYCDQDYIVKSEQVEWQHSLGDIVSAMIDAGLKIEFLHEFKECVYPKTKEWIEEDGWYYPPTGRPNYPMMFSIRAIKS